MKIKLELAGQRFGMLTAKHVAGRGSGKAVIWYCTCDCGGDRLVTAARLNANLVTQCGCISRRQSKMKIAPGQKAPPPNLIDNFLYNYPAPETSP